MKSFRKEGPAAYIKEAFAPLVVVRAAYGYAYPPPSSVPFISPCVTPSSKSTIFYDIYKSI